MAAVTIHGPDGDAVGVIDEHLLTIAVVESEFEHESEHNNRSFTWSSVAADVGAAETILLVQNDSEALKLHIERTWGTTDAASEFDVHLTNKAALTPAGTAVVAVNLHGVAVAPAIAKGLESNNTQGNIIATINALAGVTWVMHWGGAVILEKGESIAIDLTLASGSLASAGVSGYYKET